MEMTNRSLRMISAIILAIILNVSSMAQKRIIVIGSSTAEGAGASCPDSTWTGRVGAWLEQQGRGDTLINLAKGGYTTCQEMPTGTPDYQANEHLLSVDTTRNITKALSLGPDIIIINLPTNDTSHGIDVKTQLRHFDSIVRTAHKECVEVFVTTSQPHNFGEKYQPPYNSQHRPDASKQNFRNRFTELTGKIQHRYGRHAIDFFNVIATDDGLAFIKPEFDSGDGVHLNDAAHAIFADRVIEKLNESLY